jgi:hypothetical protein
MTQETPASSLNPPNSVIGQRIAGLDLLPALEAAIHGHHKIVAAIAEHALAAAQLRETRREAAARGELLRG